jgi:2Fe-2S ferredoxin
MTVTIHLVAPDGRQNSISARAGQSLMRAATAGGIAEIAADCGGCLTCATCHVIVDGEWATQLPAASADEDAMLDLTAVPRRAGSRLSCQVVLQPWLDGLVAHLPERQY